MGSAGMRIASIALGVLGGLNGLVVAWFLLAITMLAGGNNPSLAQVYLGIVAALVVASVLRRCWPLSARPISLTVACQRSDLDRRRDCDGHRDASPRPQREGEPARCPEVRGLRRAAVGVPVCECGAHLEAGGRRYLSIDPERGIATYRARSGSSTMNLARS